ncbi:hypothetical protein NQ317_002453 [Molorchus minor]|uniref:Protein FAM76A n=1 Tax=Molorchus minor TaxID=1323400 RepID=A0ABQ9J8C4_9CUCU|nr:hypothetical protein NQ317_002453 [Molorchus minor]
MSAPLLFACSRCFARFPFEELSAGQQLCKYCNIIAAFIGNKCQRCTNSEIKYGPPVNCEQCKQKCAFDRQDDDKKVDGKLLCWLCTLSYKRALAKTKQGDADRRAHMKISQLHKNKHKDGKLRSHSKRPNRPDVTKIPPPDDAPPNKVSRNNSAPVLIRADLDPTSSDHVVAMTQLKEQIASLQKQVNQKNGELLNKDKLAPSARLGLEDPECWSSSHVYRSPAIARVENALWELPREREAQELCTFAKEITELKATNFTTENELRFKLKTLQKEHEGKVDGLNNRISNLLKEIASLSKTAKKGRGASAAAAASENNSSGTDSPSTQ